MMGQAILTLVMSIVFLGIAVAVFRYVLPNRQQIISRFGKGYPPMDNDFSWKARYRMLVVAAGIAALAMLGASVYYFIKYFTGS